MKKSILSSAIAAATVISITACSSGGSDVAGIGGSGVTSSGTITGFGSIFVNGVEFHTNSSNFSIDDNPGSESDLAIGMRVTVQGTLNADGVSGTATSVSYDDDLEGPVSNIADIGNDGLVREFKLLGRTVRINSTTTNFDVSSSLPPGTPFDFGRIENDDHVEVSGFLDSNGVLIATRVELKALVFDINSIVEMKGTIENLDPGPPRTFNLVNTTGVTIDADAAGAIIDNDLPGGLVDGTFVEVKGKCSDVSCTTINADKIENGLDDFGNNDDVEIEGIITRYVDDSDFDINGFPVDASSAVKEPSTLTLALDKKVEVEGAIVNDVLIASKVEDEGGDIKIAAIVTDVNSLAGSFELSPRSGQPSITVMIDTSTEIEDEIRDIDSAALLDDLSIDTDFVVVEGYEDETGNIIASKVERKSKQNDVIVQGKLESITQDVSVTVLGVEFGIDDLAETDFENALDVDISQVQFITDAPVGTLVKIKDKDTGGGTNGIADEVEIEN